MSFDLNLQTRCNHKILMELSVLGPDRRTLRVSKPIAAAGNMNVYASDNYVPRSAYTVIDDPNSLAEQPMKMVYFNTPWKAISDQFAVTYGTIASFCPKCMGRNTLDDINYDTRGQASTLRNENLLLQNLEKFTVTILRSNPFHLFIGTGLDTLIAKKITDIEYLTAQITQEINASLAKLKDMQQQYARTGRSVSTGEQLDKVESVTVTQDQDDPTILRVEVRATALSGKQVTYFQSLQTPQG